ncbi:MAG: cytochrome c oxidase accessory protein CcoG [Planctomycetes bacterium]|nr:cytochrome c oxidase accessory protein CcoG [Planctomycetota bacterium]
MTPPAPKGSLADAKDSKAEPAPPEGARAEPQSSPLAPPGEVLSTLRKDGTRRWIRPRPSEGRFLSGRRGVAYGLMAVFLTLPHVVIGGKPAILLDVVRRRFTLFGATFVSTDTLFLLLAALAVFLTVFLLTALFGRVWCGWACPQTVYMEFLFRPLDRLFEGSYQQQAKLDREGGGIRRVAKHVVIVAISVFLAHTFLAYFVGWSTLMGYLTTSPAEHPTAFAVMVSVSGAMAFNFGWFREQTCLVACPYGRLQSVLLDQASLVVGYDTGRGEPRGKAKKGRAVAVAERGDCIDCRACVTTCPTGIDIRDGLQLECIGCAQCIDACDAIMTRTGKPLGLVRYGARSELEGGTPSKILRPRVVIYALALLLVLGGLGGALLDRPSAKVKALRGIGAPFVTLPSGEISNQIRLKIHNQSDQSRSYTLSLITPSGAQLVAPENPIQIGAGELAEATLFVVLPRAAYAGTGELPCQLEVADGVDFERVVTLTLLGPSQ